MIEGNSSKFGMVDLGGVPLVPDEIGAPVIKRGLARGDLGGEMPAADRESIPPHFGTCVNCML